MKKIIRAGIIAICAAAACAFLTACQSNSPAGAASTAGNGSGQILPVGSNPIKNSATASGLAIVAAEVENNVDPSTNNPIPDCLQIKVKNNSNQKMGNFEIYYSMSDSKTGAREGYYQKLYDLSLAPGQSQTIFFDNGKAPGHYPENKYSIYRSSKNEVRFSIELSTPGFRPATARANKGPGTGEQKD
ncbi:MAG: hypothetical protein ACYDET_09600 [Thermoleophilia bacterium]